MFRVLKVHWDWTSVDVEREMRSISFIHMDHMDQPLPTSLARLNPLPCMPCPLRPAPHRFFFFWSVNSAAQRQFIDCIETGYVPHINRTYLADWLTDWMPRCQLLGRHSLCFAASCVLRPSSHFLPVKGDSSQVEEKLHAVSRAAAKLMCLSMCGAQRTVSPF